MSDTFDYLVEVEEITPLGENRFAAKVPYIVKNPGPNSKRIYPHFHEWWGKTREEAESKAKAEAEKWIAEQSGKSS
jgi:hypothetical protein